jgi:hypothetical protein
VNFAESVTVRKKFFNCNFCFELIIKTKICNTEAALTDNLTDKLTVKQNAPCGNTEFLILNRSGISAANGAIAAAVRRFAAAVRANVRKIIHTDIIQY